MVSYSDISTKAARQAEGVESCGNDDKLNEYDITYLTCSLPSYPTLSTCAMREQRLSPSLVWRGMPVLVLSVMIWKFELTMSF